MAKGCICGKATVCAAAAHPNVASKNKLTQNRPALHMERRPGETFAEMEKRLDEAAK